MQVVYNLNQNLINRISPNSAIYINILPNQIKILQMAPDYKPKKWAHLYLAWNNIPINEAHLFLECAWDLFTRPFLYPYNDQNNDHQTLWYPTDSNWIIKWKLIFNNFNLNLSIVIQFSSLLCTFIDQFDSSWKNLLIENLSSFFLNSWLVDFMNFYEHFNATVFHMTQMLVRKPSHPFSAW